MFKLKKTEIHSLLSATQGLELVNQLMPSNIRIPFLTKSDLKPLRALSENVFIDSVTKSRHQKTRQFIMGLWKKTGTLCQWIDLTTEQSILVRKILKNIKKKNLENFKVFETTLEKIFESFWIISKDFCKIFVIFLTKLTWAWFQPDYEKSRETLRAMMSSLGVEREKLIQSVLIRTNDEDLVEVI